MIYKGYFRDIKNDDLHTVVITTDGSSIEKEITLGATPFTTEMDSSNDTIYQPAKYQSATVKFITPDYNLDIYNKTAQGTKVELYKGSTLLWTGYATPNLYDMGFEKPKEEVDIDCIDALSTLQYVKFLPITKNADGKAVLDKSVDSFANIIQYLLKQCKAYTKFYVSNNTQLSDKVDNAIMNQLFISKANFFDSKDDESQTDKEVAWTCQEVLEELCRFLNVTVIADGDSVYFLDYDAIRNGINTYYQYSLTDVTNHKLVKLEFAKEIVGSEFSQNGNTISIDNVYNKVTVNCDLNDFDTVIPNMFDTVTNITADSDDTLASSDNINNGMYGEVIKTNLGDNNNNNNNMIICIDRVRNPQKKNYSDYNIIAVKYFNNPYYKFYKYDANGNDITDTIKQLNYTDTKSLHGATLAKFFVKKLDKSYEWVNQWLDQILKNKNILDIWLINNGISNITFSDYILMLNPSDNHFDNSDITKYPYFETTVQDSTALFGGKNAYLVISGSYKYHYFDDDPYPIPENESDISKGRYVMDVDDTYFLAKLQWGKYYWNGDKYNGLNAKECWVTDSNTTFKIPYLKEGSISDRRADATMFKDMNIVNNVSWRIGTDKEGYLIPISEDYILNGLPKITVYKPYDPNYGRHGQYYKHSVVLLKNFSIEAFIGDPTFSKTNDTDTKYTNIINEGFVQDLSDIDFKVNTWDNKKPNFSCVGYKKDDDTFAFVDTLFNKALSKYEKGTERFNGTISDGSLRMEEHLVYRIINQYSSPNVKLNFSLRNNNKIYGLFTDYSIRGRKFIVDAINTDYRFNKQELVLIEKKPADYLNDGADDSGFTYKLTAELS